MASAPESKNVVSPAELGTHKTQEDLWAAVHGKVYNLTAFAPDHPGGIEVLKDCAGTDASETFEYAGHGDDQAKKLDRFRVGVLEGSEPATDSGAAQAAVAGAAAPRSEGAANNNKGTLDRAWSNLGAYTGRLPAMSGAATLGLLIFLLFGAFNFFGFIGREGYSDGKLEPRHGVNPVYAFWEGLLLASSLSCAGMGFVYLRFSETLKHEEDVFHYPAVIPRRVA